MIVRVNIIAIDTSESLKKLISSKTFKIIVKDKKINEIFNKVVK